MWTARQRGALVAIAAGLLGFLAVRYALNPSVVTEPQPQAGARAAEVAGRIDPNTADAAALAALPVIGPAVAQRIVDYRQAFVAEHPGEKAFTKVGDLERVKGIGPATVRAIAAYLLLPDAADE